LVHLPEINMAESNILGGDPSPARPPGHSTAELGPSDTSDSGSDILGAPGLAEDAGLEGELGDIGTTSDLDRGYGAGPDLGDADLDSDSDAAGTGERMTAGRDSSAREANDIQTDRVTRNPGGLTQGEDPEGIGVSYDPRRGPRER
jgi:hypothetical protein